MKKLLFTLTFLFIATVTSLALNIYDFDKVKYYQPGETYCGISENPGLCFISVGVHHSGENVLLVCFGYDVSKVLIFTFNEGDAKIEEARQAFTFNGFDLSDVKVISDVKLSNRLIIARIGRNVFLGEYDPKSCVFNKAAIVDSEYAPQVDKAINDAINQGILISYLKPATAPQETQPVQQQQRPSRPTTGSTQKRK